MIRNEGMNGENVFLTKSAYTKMLKENALSKITAGGLFVRERDESGDPTAFGHTGSSDTNIWIDFERDTIGIMLTQTRGSDIRPFRIELERRIMDLVKNH